MERFWDCPLHVRAPATQWQRRFWEHTINDEEDFDNHFDYILWSPVKRGYATCLSGWPHSSFHRWVKQEVYPASWGCGHRAPGGVARVMEAGE